MFRTLIVHSSGYRQTREHNTGIEAVWLTAYDYAGGPTLVEFFAWNFNVKEYAKFIERHAAPDAVIVLIGYSWGGDRVLDLARELKKRGVRVRWLILCDAVYNSNWLLLNGLSLTDAPWMTVPSNVEEVYAWRQRNKLPKGHRVRAEDANATKLHVVELKEHNHQTIDESWEFFSTCAEVFERVISLPRVTTERDNLARNVFMVKFRQKLREPRRAT